MGGPSVFLGEPVAATPEVLAGRGFGEGGLADTLAPGPALEVLTAAAAGCPAALTDGEMLGAAAAARRLQARAEWLEIRQVAEFSRLNQARFEAAASRGERQRYHEGEFGVEELHFTLNISRQDARYKMDLARNVDDRLPAVAAKMSQGLLGAAKVRHIHHFTAPLSDEKAAAADKILAEAAPALSPRGVYARARKVCYALDPRLFDRMREEAARRHQRVEVGQEDSGNARVAIREMAVADAAAIRAGIDAEAARLKNAGLDAPLRQIRFWIARDRALGLDPWARLAATAEPPDDYGSAPPGDIPADVPADVPDIADAPGASDDAGVPGEPPGDIPGDMSGADDIGDFGDAGWSPSPDGDGSGRFPADDGYRHDDEDDDDDGDGRGGDEGPGGGGPDEGRPGGRPGGGGGAAPLPGLINILVPAGTLFGWSDALGEAGGWGLLAPAQAREFVAAASRHPRSRWCVTLVDPESGEAVAHGCARGRHPWQPAAPRDGDGPGAQRQRLYDLLRGLNVTLEPIAKGTCDHRHEEQQYIPSRKLKHLIRARSATCSAPACEAHALYNETDHTQEWPAGKTDECNLSGPCSRHHHAKHAPGWDLRQTEPGHMRWTTPSGRTFTTGPTKYDL
jgi:hypothetical protein